jgi:hypothetical protein
MKKEEIRQEALNRFPRSKPLNYLNEGKIIGFQQGALWINELSNQLLQDCYTFIGTGACTHTLMERIDLENRLKTYLNL